MLYISEEQKRQYQSAIYPIKLIINLQKNGREIPHTFTAYNYKEVMNTFELINKIVEIYGEGDVLSIY